MLRTGAMRAQRRQMYRRAIALVLIETVLRVLRMQLQTPAIELYLGQDRGGRNGRHQRITLHNGLRGHV